MQVAWIKLQQNLPLQIKGIWEWQWSVVEIVTANVNSVVLCNISWFTNVHFLVCLSGEYMFPS